MHLIFNNNTLSGTKTLNGTLSGITTLNGILSGGILNNNTLSGITTLNGILSGGILNNNTLSGNVTLSGTLSGGILTNNTLSGNTILNGTLSGGILTNNTLSGNTILNGTLSGILSGCIINNSSLTGSITISGTLNGGIYNNIIISGASTALTLPSSDNSDKIATTAFVKSIITMPSSSSTTSDIPNIVNLSVPYTYFCCSGYTRYSTSTAISSTITNCTIETWIYAENYDFVTIGIGDHINNSSTVVLALSDDGPMMAATIDGRIADTDIIRPVMPINQWVHLSIIFTVGYNYFYIFLNGTRYRFYSIHYIPTLTGQKLIWTTGMYQLRLTNFRVCNFKVYDSNMTTVPILPFPNIMPIISDSLYHINSAIINKLTPSNHNIVSVVGYNSSAGIDVSTLINNYAILPSTASLASNPLEIKIPFSNY